MSEREAKTSRQENNEAEVEDPSTSSTPGFVAYVKTISKRQSPWGQGWIQAQKCLKEKEKNH